MKYTKKLQSAIADPHSLKKTTDRKSSVTETPLSDQGSNRMKTVMQYDLAPSATDVRVGTRFILKDLQEQANFP